MDEQIGTKKVVIDGREYEVKIFKPSSAPKKAPCVGSTASTKPDLDGCIHSSRGF